MFLDHQTSKNPSTNTNAMSNLNNQNKEHDHQPTLKRQLIKFGGEKVKKHKGQINSTSNSN